MLKSMHGVIAGSNVWMSDPWNVENAVYDSVSSSISAESSIQGLFMRADGLRTYLLGFSQFVYQYNLSVAWDLSTQSSTPDDSEDLFPILDTEQPGGLFFRDNGLRMYIGDGNGTSTTINQFTLSSAWNISTASLDHKTVLPGTIRPRGLYFKPDGLKMFLADPLFDFVREYALSTAWDTSSVSSTFDLDISDETLDLVGLAFKTDGSKMYLPSDESSDRVFEYDLSTPWLLSSASYNSVVKVTKPPSVNLSDIYFKSDGTKLYTSDTNTDLMYQYSV